MTNLQPSHFCQSILGTIFLEAAQKHPDIFLASFSVMLCLIILFHNEDSDQDHHVNGSALCQIFLTSLTNTTTTNTNNDDKDHVWRDKGLLKKTL